MKNLACLLFVLCLVVPIAWAQTSPCDTPPSSAVVVNPREVLAALPEFDRKLVDGTTIAVPGYEVGFFSVNNSSTAPFQSGGQIAKAEWTLSAGTTDCYNASLPGLAAVPIGQRFYARLRAVGDPAIGTSAWSDVSSPFGLDPPPVPPGLPLLRP